MHSPDEVLQTLAHTLSDCIGDKEPSLYLYGSAVLDDFCPGWSDMDVLILTEAPLKVEEAEGLVTLRQEWVERTGNPLFGSLEGAILSREAFVTGAKTPVVYWGTSGQRVRESYSMDPFSLWLLKRRGRCLLGQDRRCSLPDADFAALQQGVRQHYETIRQHAQTTQANLYAFGWMLDIARGLYTLATGTVIAKTRAGEWALQQGLCPEPEAMERSLCVRRNPGRIQDPAIRSYALTMGDKIQRFADVLEGALDKGKQ